MGREKLELHGAKLVPSQLAPGCPLWPQGTSKPACGPTPLCPPSEARCWPRAPGRTAPWPGHSLQVTVVHRPALPVRAIPDHPGGAPTQAPVPPPPSCAETY